MTPQTLPDGDALNYVHRQKQVLCLCHTHGGVARSFPP